MCHAVGLRGESLQQRVDAKEYPASMGFPKSVRTSRKAELTTALNLSFKYKSIPLLTPNLNPSTQLDDLSKEFVKQFAMASTKASLVSFLTLVTLSTITPAAAFSGKFEISDLCVDSPFQVDVTSTANSTISCTSGPLSIMTFLSLRPRAALHQHRSAPAPPLSISRTITQLLSLTILLFSHLLRRKHSTNRAFLVLRNLGSRALSTS
jgi:hypothetical protein